MKADELKVGDTFSTVVVEDLKRTQIVQYAGAGGDFNPIHTDEIFVTQAAGYPSVFAHGMLTMAMTARVLTDHFGNGRLRRFGVRFTSSVWPGDTLTAKAVVENIVSDAGETLAELRIETCNQRGEVVMSGHASSLLD